MNLTNQQFGQLVFCVLAFFLVAMLCRMAVRKQTKEALSLLFAIFVIAAVWMSELGGYPIADASLGAEATATATGMAASWRAFVDGALLHPGVVLAGVGIFALCSMGLLLATLSDYTQGASE